VGSGQFNCPALHCPPNSMCSYSGQGSSGQFSPSSRFVFEGMNFRLSVINSIRSLEKSIFGQICLFLIKISPMASKKRKLEIDEDDDRG